MCLCVHVRLTFTNSELTNRLKNQLTVQCTYDAKKCCLGRQLTNAIPSKHQSDKKHSRIQVIILMNLIPWHLESNVMPKASLVISFRWIDWLLKQTCL